jgi:uncharacterized protein with HEPN domain
MKRNPRIFLEDILESISIIEEYIALKSYDDFRVSIEMQDKIIRRLEIIGEAIKNVPLVLRKKYLDIPWKKYAGLRDVLIHHYFGIDYELTWNIIQNDIPILKLNIKKIINSLDPELF